MAWIPYKITFRLLSPLNVGWKKTGNLQQTRPYVTGNTLWGALTARLVRDQGNNNYKDIGKKVDDELRFTYFYPTTAEDDVKICPWDNFDEFSWQFLSSYASTALSGKTAEEGTLHETEYISPKTREGNQVYLIGYIIEKDGCNLNWIDALNRLQLGGERGYGWGKVNLIGDPEMSNKCFDYVFDGTKDSPQIIVPKGERIFAHAMADKLECKGTIEPLVGRETSKKRGFGGVISEAKICWMPGSIVNKEISFEISSRGIWKEVQ
ncbi:hypothetical protein BMS3Bbin15_00001 [archaeon BMS3Bbin15]|nr:hypothetical protein BMS3Bbin15_00001 [archaeon BMS3Bbin15]